MNSDLKLIRATIHRSVMPNWSGVRVTISGPRELLDQIMVLGRDGYMIVTPPPGLRYRAPSRSP